MNIGISTLGLLPAKMENILEFTSKNKIKYLEIIHEYPYQQPNPEGFDAYDIQLSFHAPISDINIASPNETIRQASIREIVETFKTANTYNAEIVTVHSGQIPTLATEFTEKIIENQKKSLQKLCKESEEYGIKMCIENMPPEDNILYSNLEALYEDIKELNCGITLDVGHAANGYYTIEEMLSTDKIWHINLNDEDEKGNMHKYLGIGEFDYPKFFKTLTEKNYSGICTIEVNSMIEIYKSIDYLKNISIL